MAHPYSSTPMFGATGSYAPPQSPYYPQYAPTSLQQQVHTPPGLPQQGPQIQAPQPYQSAPAQHAVARFDTSLQGHPSASAFPPLPVPNSNTFNADLLKQFATAGLPPLPPPPTYPPAPLPNAGFSHFSQALSTPTSAAYPQHYASGGPNFGASFRANEQGRQHEQFPAYQPSLRGGTDMGPYMESDIHKHNGTRFARNAHAAQPLAQEKDQPLPSFGSRSDLDMLFASAQNQMIEHSVESTAENSSRTGNPARPPQDSVREVSPYDPSRPAPVSDRRKSASGLSRNAVLSSKPPPRARTYDNISLTELRQLAKGALISLVPHKILFADLQKEGIHPRVLQDLYGELGLPTEATPSSLLEAQYDLDKREAPTESNALITASVVQDPSPEPNAASSQPATEMASLPVSAPVQHAANQTTASTLSMERKDRIAQLLAAKAGRQTSATSPAQKDQASPVIASKPMSLPPAGPEKPPSATDAPAAETVKTKSNTDLVKQRMEQMKREAAAKLVQASGSEVSETPTVRPNDESRDNASPSVSMIPGLFMSATGSFGADGTLPPAKSFSSSVTATSATDAFAFNGNIVAQAVGSGPTHTSEQSTVSLKRPLDQDSSIRDFDSRKRVALEIPLSVASTLVQQDTADAEQSEGEIVEDFVDSGKIQVPVLKEPELRSNHEKTVPAHPPSKHEGPHASSAESGQGERFRDKKTEIEAMRRKIAELEQRSKQRKAKPQTESPVASSSPTPALAAEISVPAAPSISAPNAQAEPVSSSNITPRQPLGPRTISRLTPAQLAERAAALKADLLKQRAQRQAVLQEGLPDLNAEVQKTESRLQKTRNDLAKARLELQNARAALDRSVKRESQLADEVSQLENQLQEGRSGQKQYAEELNQITLEKLSEDRAEPVQQVQPAEATDEQSDQVEAKSGAVLANPSPNMSDDLDEAVTEPSQEVPLPESAGVLGADPANAAGGDDDEGVNGLLAEPAEHSLSGPGSHSEAPTPHQGSTPSESALPQNDDMEIVSEKVDAELRHATPSQASHDSLMDMDSASDDSVSMSDSASEKYDEDDFDPGQDSRSQARPESGVDSDEYVPPEEVEDLTPKVEGGATDAYDPQVPLETNASSLPEPPIFDNAAPIQVDRTVLTDFIADQLGTDTPSAASELSSEHQPDLDGPPGFTSVLDGRSPPPTHYVPYKTPLSAFKTYRFHQDFNDTVKSGYRSLTYSNNIDPSRPLCSTELSGKACTDPSCEEQHFSQLGLPDDKILVQMSSASDIQDKDVRDRFLVGLKDVIADLRERDVKGFESVAEALSAYRRRFFTGETQDHSSDEEDEEGEVEMDVS